mgnify:CR=1 FL=1
MYSNTHAFDEIITMKSLYNNLEVSLWEEVYIYEV